MNDCLAPAPLPPIPAAARAAITGPADAFARFATLFEGLAGPHVGVLYLDAHLNPTAWQLYATPTGITSVLNADGIAALSAELGTGAVMVGQLLASEEQCVSADDARHVKCLRATLGAHGVRLLDYIASGRTGARSLLYQIPPLSAPVITLRDAREAG